MFHSISFLLGLLEITTCYYGGSGDYVTYLSGMKLVNEPYKMRLFSGNGFYYGGENEEQTVSAQDPQNDQNALWIIERANGSTRRGEVVRCNDSIKLRHVNTGKTLYSVNVRSPLSNQQLVTAQCDHHSTDTGDQWIVECTGWHDHYWQRSGYVRLRHADTGAYLSISGQYYQYPMPLNGHMEVVASFLGQNDLWSPEAGVFFKRPSSHGDGIHSEL